MPTPKPKPMTQGPLDLSQLGKYVPMLNGTYAADQGQVFRNVREVNPDSGHLGQNSTQYELHPLELEYLRAQMRGAKEDELKAIQDQYYQQPDEEF